MERVIGEKQAMDEVGNTKRQTLHGKEEEGYMEMEAGDKVTKKEAEELGEEEVVVIGQSLVSVATTTIKDGNSDVTGNVDRVKVRIPELVIEEGGSDQINQETNRKEDFITDTNRNDEEFTCGLGTQREIHEQLEGEQGDKISTLTLRANDLCQVRHASVTEPLSLSPDSDNRDTVITQVDNLHASTTDAASANCLGADGVSRDVGGETQEIVTTPVADLSERDCSTSKAESSANPNQLTVARGLEDECDTWSISSDEEDNGHFAHVLIINDPDSEPEAIPDMPEDDGTFSEEDVDGARLTSKHRSDREQLEVGEEAGVVLLNYVRVAEVDVRQEGILNEENVKVIESQKKGYVSGGEKSESGVLNNGDDKTVESIGDGDVMNAGQREDFDMQKGIVEKAEWKEGDAIATFVLKEDGHHFHRVLAINDSNTEEDETTSRVVAGDDASSEEDDETDHLGDIADGSSEGQEGGGVVLLKYLRVEEVVMEEMGWGGERTDDAGYASSDAI